MSKVALSSIPTLRQLYGNSALRAAGKQARYVSNGKLLDCVSLMSVLEDLDGTAAFTDEWSLSSSMHSQGDITELEVDAIVNAANKSLLGWC